MEGKSVYKIPNGKLLKIFLDYNNENGSINAISITGDFFAYPEEAMDILEDELKGVSLDRKCLLEKINSVIQKYGIQFIGLDAEGLTHGILMCKT
ncbi:MAG: lipoate protein ligase C-terminal domain-containing protein [Candidatus Thermoplasmatota archaeon]|jgi:lipoate-protein ligase A|nr:lipoate protein ligase C-terminal domain-containing protein [Candidatus Thermoplasmatota archaeon]